MPLINSFDSWTRLREVWLGDVYPVEWYEDLPGSVRDVFQTITEWTREDLAQIEKKLVEDFGVIVRRPQYLDIEDHLDPRFRHKNLLSKPQITPRDHFLVYGNTLYIPAHIRHNPSWNHVLDEYRNDLASKVVDQQLEVGLSGANTVRVGRDLFVDCVWSVERIGDKQSTRRYFDEHVVPLFPESRVHYLDNGGHIDACFAVLKPGHLIANRYFEDYDQTFPGWQRLMMTDPTFRNTGRYAPGFGNNGKFWLPNDQIKKTLSDTQTAAFNDHVINYALDWVGNYTETYFEVNCLVIDENNVMVLGENESVFRHLESHGITAHPMPFRCRTFWDGGLHCLTVDIRRDGGMAEYL